MYSNDRRILEIWWIHYFADGQRHREKVGRKSDAIALYQTRKAETRARIKLAPTDPQTFNLNHGLIAQLQADIADLNQKMDRVEVLLKRLNRTLCAQDSNAHTEVSDSGQR